MILRALTRYWRFTPFLLLGAILSILFTVITGQPVGFDPLADILIPIVGVIALGMVGLFLRRQLAGSTRTSRALVDTAPERVVFDSRVAGLYIRDTLEEAEALARAQGFEAGIEPLRDELKPRITALLAIQHGREHATEAVERGNWTDDAIAGAFVSSSVPFPDQSFSDRLRLWLFPDIMVRRYFHRSVRALTTVAEESLPVLAGKQASARVPVARLSIDDGTLRIEDNPAPDPLPVSETSTVDDSPDTSEGHTVREVSQ